MVSNSFNFFEDPKSCFNKHGCNFDDVREIGYSVPSWYKVTLKKAMTS